MREIFLGNDLEEIEKQIWQLLNDSVHSYKAPFHHGIIATINEHFPEQRTVVLRNVILAKKALCFHTDIRSKKIDDLTKNNSVSWLFYNEELKLQLRIYAKAFIHHQDEFSENAWSKARLQSKLCYTTAAKSGNFIEIPELIDLNRKDVSNELLSFARENFCVIETQAHALDFVFLNANGNKRGFFDYRHQFSSWRQI